MKGLKWITNDFQLKPEEELNLIAESIKYLKKNKENSMIITYYQFINSEIDHNIYSPNRWYTSDGVSYPFSMVNPVLHKSQCLTLNGNSVGVKDCVNSNKQRWEGLKNIKLCDKL